MILPGEKKPVSFPQSGNIVMPNRQAYLLPLNVPLASGDRVRYATCEILGIRESGNRKTLTVCGAADSTVEIELATSLRKASVKGAMARVKAGRGTLRINFTADGSEQKIEIR